MNYTKTSWENDITPVSAENMNKIENQLKALTDAIYPVGAIYMSMNATSPATLFGGTWERIGVGRTLVSAGGGDGAVVDENSYTGRGTNTAEIDWFPVGETGGELSHTLTVTEMPKHRHSVSVPVSTSTKYGTNSGGKAPKAASTSYNTGYTGGDGVHNTMQTYLAVYMWKRTA